MARVLDGVIARVRSSVGAGRQGHRARFIVSVWDGSSGAEAGVLGSVLSGQGGHTSQGVQQARVYVNPPEEHGLVQPLIMVV